MLRPRLTTKQLNDKQKRLLDQVIKNLDVKERKSISAVMIKRAKKRVKPRRVPHAMKMTCGPQKMKIMTIMITIRTVPRKNITPIVR